MSNFGTTDWFQRASAGTIAGVKVVQLVGFREVGQILEPVNSSGFYRMPPTATPLELVSTSPDDNAAGPGARAVRLVGLVDGTWEEATELVFTNGTTPVPIATNFVRIYSAAVEQSGTYADALGGSHVGEIRVQELGGGDLWTLISLTPHPMGRALISSYSIPRGRAGFISSVVVSADTNKTVDVVAPFRLQADVISGPFGTRLTLLFAVGISGPITLSPRGLVGPIVGPADFLVMAQSDVASAGVTVNVEILLVDEP